MTKFVLIVLGCLILALYLYPAGTIYFKPAKSLPPGVSAPASTEIIDLSVPRQNTLLYARGFVADQLSNEAFPSVITGNAPGSAPSIPAPRIRTAITDSRDWFSWVVNVVYFPMLMVAGGGTILFGIIAIAALCLAIPFFFKRFKFFGVPLTLVMVALFAVILYLLTIYPGYFRETLKDKQPLVWDKAPASHYIEGGFSVPPDEPAFDSRIAVVNGTSGQIDLYADGLYIERVPAQGFRTYRELRGISRLTALDAATGTVLDDINFTEPPLNQEGLLIYNVQAMDTIHIDSPPAYH
jgi:hypothetical protein